MLRQQLMRRRNCGGVYFRLIAQHRDLRALHREMQSLADKRCLIHIHQRPRFGQTIRPNAHQCLQVTADALRVTMHGRFRRSNAY